MYLLAIPFTFLEIAIFLIAVIAFLLAIRFFIASQKNLENLLPEKRKKSSLGFGIDRDGFIVPTAKERLSKSAQKMLENNEETKQEIKELRDMLQLQQLELSRALRQIETLNEVKGHKVYHDDVYEDEHYDEEPGYVEQHHNTDKDFTEELKHQLERKEAELRDFGQQAELNKKLQSHFEEVQTGYEELQNKVEKMEQQAWQAAEMSIKVDSLEQSNEQLE